MGSLMLLTVYYNVCSIFSPADILINILHIDVISGKSSLYLDSGSLLVAYNSYCALPKCVSGWVVAEHDENVINSVFCMFKVSNLWSSYVFNFQRLLSTRFLPSLQILLCKDEGCIISVTYKNFWWKMFDFCDTVHIQ